MPEAKKPRWWVYVMRCTDGTLYTGVTTDVARRLVDAGMRVTGISRSTAGDAKVVEAGGQPLRGDLADPAPLLDAAATSVQKLVSNYELAIKAASAAAGK